MNRRSSIQFLLIYYGLYHSEVPLNPFISLLLFYWGLPIVEEDGYCTNLQRIFTILREVLHTRNDVENQCLNILQESSTAFGIRLSFLIILALQYPALLQQFPQFLSSFSKQEDIAVIYSALFQLKRNKEEFLSLTVHNYVFSQYIGYFIGTAAYRCY